MKLTVLQENLIQAINVVSRATDNHGQLAVLGNILLKTEAGRLKLSATNLETGINIWVGAKIIKEGQITVPARIFSELINLMPKDQINLEVKEEKVKVSCQKQQSTVLGMNAVDFPEVPSLKNSQDLGFQTSFSAQDLKKIITRLAFAAAQDESRPALTGVLLKRNSDQWTWVTTDGYRLSLIESKQSSKVSGNKTDKVGTESKKNQQWLIPARTLTELERLISDSDADIKMAIAKDGNQVIYQLDDIEIVSKLIEGKFPDYEKVIPTGHKNQLKLDRQELVNAVKAAVIFARDAANIVQLDLKKTKIEVSAQAPELGENKTELEVKLTGEPGKIAFNGRYLLEFLNAVTAEQVEFNYSGELNPGLFQEAGFKDFTHVIMPVRVQE